MQETLGKRLIAPQVKASVNVIPQEVQDKFSVTKDSLMKVTLEVTNTGYNAPKSYIRFYCNDCQRIFLPKLLGNQRFGNFDSLETLITNYDNSKIPSEHIENVGCFVWMKRFTWV